ncbi:ribosomal L7Ae/L30e/S12e/Gadd45 family protein [Paenibacillus tarimensis]
MPFKIGTKQTKKMVEHKRASLVYVAKDADPRITNDILRLCGTAGIEVIWVETMTDLGKTCGIDVGAAAAAVVPDEE